MSVALSNRRRRGESIKTALPWIGMGLCLAAFLSYVAYDRLLAAKPATSVAKAALSKAQANSEPGREARPAAGRVTTVTLDDTKFAVAKIAIEEVRVDQIATGVSVVGQIQANSDRQVEVRPRASGIIREVHARLGQKVKRGDPLVILDSREIGTERLNLRSKQRELSTARFEARWKSEIASNIALLIPELKKGINERRSGASDDDHVDQPRPQTKTPVANSSTDARIIERNFAGKQLGTYRGTLLQLYAEFDTASHEEQKQAYLLAKEIVGEHPALVARHVREGIQAKLEGAIEQVQFDAAQEQRLALMGVRLAEAAVIDAGQRLRILGVPEDIQSLLDQADLANTIARDEDVTFYRIDAPFEGTIIKKDAVFSRRADLTDVLFIVADLRSVWVTANVTESDVAKLPTIKDGAFRMSATAYPGREFRARLLSVGATVDPATRTVAVLAQAENADDLFKLGMFVRIHLDSSTSESVLTVPAAAAVELEGQNVVFVPARNSPENRVFFARPVELGAQTGDRVVVKAGLKKGDQIVSSGSFMLKSELILENQDDEGWVAMLNAIIQSSLNNRFLVLMATLLVGGLGVYSALHLPIDAVPDLTNVQVQVITEAPALSPVEADALLAFPVSGAMSGLPDVEQIRSVSKFGVSVVTIVFKEGTDIFRARQLVGERLSRAAEAIPAGYGTPTLGPIATALGEVFQFQVKATRESGITLMELRTLLDWFIAYQLRRVEGVTEINAHGGELKTYEVEPDPDELAARRLSMTDLFLALRSNNANVGGGYLVHEGEARYIRGVSQARSIDDIAAIVIDERNGVPVTVRDVAKVRIAPMIRVGLATRDGKGEIVTGLVMMLIGQNGREVVERVKLEIEELKKRLPPGVTIEPLYDRTHLIDQTLNTVLHNLTAGGALVMLVLLLMLGNLRGGLIVALAIPLSMLFAANVMLWSGISASLMSLGAIDFGLVVDSSVIMIENCVRRLAHEGGTRPKVEIVRDAAIEVRKPTMFGELIIAIVYLPILALHGTEGKLFRPMALTVIFALAGSLLLSLTLMPVLAALCLSSRPREQEVLLLRWAKRVYQPVLDLFIRHPLGAALLAVSLVIASVPLAFNLGGEFMPRLNEGDLLIEAVRIPSASLEGAIAVSTQIENVLKKIPEVRLVYCKTGRPEIANDVMGVHQTDVWTMLKPQDEWRKGLTRDALIEEMGKLLSENVPGVKFGFSQPIEMRVNELVAGVKSDVAVLIYGPDLKELRRLSLDVARVLSQINGHRDIKNPTAGRLPMLRITVRRDQLARYGIKASDVLDAVASLGGTTVGTVFEDDRRHPLRVRLPEAWREDPDKIGSIRVVDPQGRSIPLKDLTEIVQEEGPSEVERENAQHRAVVGVNVRGRDIVSFVAEAQAAIEKQVKFPHLYHPRWGGQFEHFQTALRRLLIVVPVTLLLIFLLLYSTFHSMRLTILISTALPMAATGGVFALYLRGMPFSISAAVGFIALFGVAVLNGLVWVSAVEHLRSEGVEPHEAAREAAVVRLRPILMTALVAGLGFIPMAIATTPGAEIQRPLATVVIGGIITSTLLSTLVLPSVYPWFARKPAIVEA